MFGKKKRKKVRIPVSEYEYYLILDSLFPTKKEAR